MARPGGTILELFSASLWRLIEAAINGHADALVTYNVADFRPAGERFRIPILRPPDLVRKVG
jgi:hypothetical protein